MTDDHSQQLAAAAERQSRARDALGSTRFADVRWLASTGSTNSDGLELLRSGEPEGIVVVADHQGAGRGRRDRVWEAPEGASLLFTVLLRPPADRAGLTTAVLALAAADAVHALTGVRPGLKWPNDLVWPGDGTGPDRKLAGILAKAEWPPGTAEASVWREPSPGQRAAVAAGMGVNVAWGDGFPEDLADRAVALDEIVASLPEPVAVPDRVDLLVELLGFLDSGYRDLLAPDGPTVVVDRWRAGSATLGRRVRVDLGADDIEGVAVDVTAEGHLVVERDEGGRKVLAVGDVIHLRPT